MRCRPIVVIFVFIAVLVARQSSWAIGRDKMYWSDRAANTINRADLDGRNVETLVSGLIQLRGVAVDTTHHMLYWADNGSNKIQRSLLDGSRIEDLVTTGLTFPAGISLDVPRNRMYWADASNQKIQTANLDGSNVTDLITDLGRPYFVTLDLENDRIYWTDFGTQRIQRANLDGSNVVDVITTGLSLPRGIDLDLDHQKLYWADRQTDQVQRSDLDGSLIEDLHLASPASAAPHGVAVDTLRQHVYWVDNGLVTIKRMNADGTDVVELLNQDDGVLVRPWQIVLDVRTTAPSCVPGFACPPGGIDARIDAISTAVLDGVNDAQYDYDRDGQVTDGDRHFLVNYVLNIRPGDADMDGQFNSADLVRVLAAGRYEDSNVRNAGWMTGDWTGDLEFDTSDIVAALSAGNYEQSVALNSVPEPRGLGVFAAMSLLSLVGYRRRAARSGVE